MDFQHARLHQGEQAVEIVDREQLLALIVLHALDVLADETRACVLLEEALPSDPVGAAQQGERAIYQMRCDVLPRGGVIVGKLLLGDLGVGPIDAVRVGEFDRRVVRGGGCFARALRRFR